MSIDYQTTKYGYRQIKLRCKGCKDVFVQRCKLYCCPECFVKAHTKWPKNIYNDKTMLRARQRLYQKGFTSINTKNYDDLIRATYVVITMEDMNENDKRARISQ